MDEITIRRVMNENVHTRNIFKGTFAQDELNILKKSNSKAFYIVNTGMRDSEGIHWVAIYFNGFNLYYFDSFAIAPTFYANIYAALLKFKANNIFMLPFRIQGISSSVCGHYCLIFLIFMCSGYLYNYFISLFSNTNFIANDALVCSYIGKKYPYANMFCGI